MEQISEVLKGLLKNQEEPLSHSYLLWKLWNQWPQLFPEPPFKGVLPVKWNEKELFLYVPHASQLQDLIFQREQMVKRINAFFKTDWIGSVRLTLHRNSTPKREESSQLRSKDF